MVRVMLRRDLLGNSLLPYRALSALASQELVSLPQFFFFFYVFFLVQGF
jgi:hypothetical protein